MGGREATDSDFLRALAFTGFFLNLFNLLPIVPLDGGRAVAALHPAFWLVGLVGLAALTFLLPNPILILILVVGGLELWSRWRGRGRPGYEEYYRVHAWQRVVVAVVYVGLAAGLGLAMSASLHRARHLARPWKTAGSSTSGARTRTSTATSERIAAGVQARLRGGRPDRPAPAVTIFGSARVREDHPGVPAARDVARRFARPASRS